MGKKGKKLKYQHLFLSLLYYLRKFSITIPSGTLRNILTQRY